MTIEKILNIKFSNKQKASSTSIRWLLNDSKYKARASGRTTLTLALLIEKALKNPNYPVIIFDHYDLAWGTRMSYKRHIIDTLKRMLQRSMINSNRITIDDQNSTLTIK
jgi:hypothetical protein